MFTFREYLEDFASAETKMKGIELIKSMFAEVEKKELVRKIEDNLCKIENGERDIYF
jgi:2-iminoacetate synthase